METIISKLLSPSNIIRGESETELKTTDHNLLIQNELEILKNSPNSATRMLCAIIIREQVTTNSEYFIYPHLTEQDQFTFTSDLISSLQQEEIPKVGNKICEALSALSNEIFVDQLYIPYYEQEQPSMKDEILKCMPEEFKPPISSKYLLLFTDFPLTKTAAQTLRPLFYILHDMFAYLLDEATSSPGFCIAATLAAIKFLHFICHKDSSITSFSSYHTRVVDILRPMMATLKDILDSGHEVEAQEALQLFIHVAIKSLSYPFKVLRNDLIDVLVDDMLFIARNHYFEACTLQLGTDFVLLFQKKLGDGKKKGLFEVFLIFLCDVDREETADVDVVDGYTNYKFGRNNLMTLAGDLSSLKINSIVIELLPTY